MQSVIHIIAHYNSTMNIGSWVEGIVSTGISQSRGMSESKEEIKRRPGNIFELWGYGVKWDELKKGGVGVYWGEEKRLKHESSMYAHRRFQRKPQHYHKALDAVMHKHNFSTSRGGAAQLTSFVEATPSLIGHAAKHCINL